MTERLQSLTSALDAMLDEHGTAPLLLALAHALRGQNDRDSYSARLPVGRELALVREYVAGQVSGLAVLWQLHAGDGASR